MRNKMSSRMIALLLLLTTLFSLMPIESFAQSSNDSESYSWEEHSDTALGYSEGVEPQKEPSPEDVFTQEITEVQNDETGEILTFPRSVTFVNAYGMELRATGTVKVNWVSGYDYNGPFKPGSGNYWGQWAIYTIDGKTAFCVDTLNFNTTNGVSMTSSTSWGSLTQQQKDLIGTTMLYGGNSGASHVATQLLIWEISSGYVSTSDLSSTWNGLYNTIAGSHSDVQNAYSTLKKNVLNHYKVPSFMNSSSTSPPTHAMPSSGTLVLTDTNGVLSNFTFTNENGLNYSKSGNTLTITASSAVSSDISVSSPKSVGSGGGVVFWTASGQQTKATSATGDPVTAYMKIGQKDATPTPDPPTPNPTPVEKDPVKVTVNIRKKDKETNQPLEGAVFEIKIAGGETLGTFFTESNGVFTIDRYISKNETLIITEISPPPGYRLDTMPRQEVTLEYKETHTTVATSVIFLNEPIKKSDLAIVKTDEFGNPIPNVVFNVKEKGSGISTTVSTGADGKGSLTDLEPTWYEITEISVPEPYILDPTPKIIELKAGELSSIRFVNKSKSVIEIIKTDDAGRPLSGAVFSVAYKTNNVHIGDFTTDSTGKIYVTGILPGEWLIITEKQSPNGFLLDETPKEILVESGKTIPVSFVNKAKPGLLIRKVDEADNMTPLEGAVFDISYKGGAPIGQYTTDASGIIRLDNFQVDEVWVTITEIKSPEGFVLSTTHQDILLKGGEIIEVVFSNKRKPNLTIEKIDSITKQGIQGVEFTIERLDPLTNSWVDIGKYTTDSNGQIVLTDLEAARYRYFESRPANGYLPNPTVFEVSVDWNKKIVETVENTPKHPIIIKKVDSKTGEPLPGATFRVSKINGELVGEYTTGRNGFVTITDLDTGWYQVVEVKAPDHYILNNTVYTVELKPGSPAIVEAENQPLAGIRIFKYNSKNKEPLEGVTIQVSHKNGQVLGNFETDRHGEIFIKDLEPGWYTVKETKTIEGFILDEKPKDIELTWGTQATVEFANIPKTGIHLLKIDSVTGKPIANISFRISKLTGEFIGDFKTNNYGKIYVELDPDWYMIQELKTDSNAGYIVDETPQTIQIMAGEPTIIERKNIPYPTLSFQKVDIQDGRPLAGVKIKVMNEKKQEIGVFTTGNAGEITLPEGELREGIFYIQEVATLPDYVLDETIREFRLYWGKTTTITLKNERNATLKLVKVDKEDPKIRIYDVEFLLMDEKNNTLGTYKTNQDGEIVFPATLKPGKYKIRELKVNKEYVLDDAIRDVILKSGETTEIVWENQKARGNIQVIKKSADDNTITKEKKGTLLKGAIFEIFDEKLNKVDTITTDENGMAESIDLALGVYTIKEKTPPDYYLKNEEVMKAEIKIHGDIVRFEVSDKSQNISVTVEKRGNVEVIAGDEIVYEFSKIQNTSNVALEEFFWNDQLPKEVRLKTVFTGVFSERLTYKIVYKTNLKKGYSTLAENLSTTVNNEIDCTPTKLGLASNEYITEIQFNFGTVQPEFKETERPKFITVSNPTLTKETQIINRTTVGGRSNKEWTYAKDGWVTITIPKKRGPLPKTGF